MGKRKKNKEKFKFNEQTFWRLARYVKPYKYKAMVGILAGLTAGGALFGGMMMIPQLVSGLTHEGDSAKKQEVVLQEKVKVITQLTTQKGLSLEQKEEKLKELLRKKQLNEVEKKVRSLQKKLDFIHVPLKLSYKERNINVVSPIASFKLPAETETGVMTWQFFSIFVLMFVAAWTLKNIATYINAYYTRWVGARVVADLRDDVFKSLMGQSLKFYGKQDVGHLISRCTNDTGVIESAIANTIADATRCPIEILACVSMIVYTSVTTKNYALPFVMFIGGPLCVLPLLLVGRLIRKIYVNAYANIANVISRMHVYRDSNC
jgi:ABC-type multidrug transport system fused ATPase/permease subunit